MNLIRRLARIRFKGRVDELRKSKPLRPIYAFVPGEQPIELVAYDRESADRLRWQDLQTRRWLVENVEADWVAVTVGADDGCHSVLLSRRASSGQILSLASGPEASALRANVMHNGCRNVSIQEQATVDAAVEAACLNRVDCIVIRGTGTDCSVLIGAERTLAKFNPWIVVSVGDGIDEGKPGSTLPKLLTLGYRSALVLDDNSYILRRGLDPEQPSPPRLELTFDGRPIFAALAHKKGAPCALPFAEQLHAHIEGCVTKDGNITKVAVPGPRWRYAADWRALDPDDDRTFILEIDLELTGGEVGFSFTLQDGLQMVDKETFVSPRAGRQFVNLVKVSPSKIGMLVLRNSDVAGTKAELRIHGLRCFDCVPENSLSPAHVLLPSTTHLSPMDLAAGLGDTTERPVGDNDAFIEIVPLENLATGFDFDRPYFPQQVYRHSLADFQTERDETSIFEYIYRNFRPLRHLEIGTWEGHGATTVARVSDAEIWTVNLPDGERDQHGNPKYSTSVIEAENSGTKITDSGSMIGWRYRQAGFGDRVHQIFCDSTKMDFSQWPKAYFDTVFIDGGHTSNVVQMDTDNCYPVLRSGGLMIWHDFCPDPETIARNEAPRGVVRAISANLNSWRPLFRRMFWIRPSWILIGVKL
jgi:hypothetical protein